MVYFAGGLLSLLSFIYLGLVGLEFVLDMPYLIADAIMFIFLSIVGMILGEIGGVIGVYLRD